MRHGVCVNGGMAKKTVRVTIPENIDDLTKTAMTMLVRNDGTTPPLPSANALVQDIANRLGVIITITTLSLPTPPSPPPGTGLIPTNLLAPLRTLYPPLARDVANLAVIHSIADQLSTSVVQRLGIAAGQTNENSNTVRAIIARITPVLKSLLAGNENEIETYGIGVTLGAATPGGGPTPPVPTPPH